MLSVSACKYHKNRPSSIPDRRAQCIDRQFRLELLEIRAYL